MTNPPPRPVAADWLTLRRPADERARSVAADLITVLGAWFQRAHATALAGGGPVHVFDLGAGTGANQAYLHPLLPFPATWTLLDHDAALLDHPAHGPARRVLAGVEELPRLLAAVDGSPVLVTCSALLDLLQAQQLVVLADALVTFATPALLSLTVNGELELAPSHPDDDLLTEAFDAHQQRNGRPGPRASTYLAERLRRRGSNVITVSTPWHINAADEPFARRWLADRADAAAEQRPELTLTARQWLLERLRAVDTGTFSAVVGHDDLLVLPAETG